MRPRYNADISFLLRKRHSPTRGPRRWTTVAHGDDNEKSGSGGQAVSTYPERKGGFGKLKNVKLNRKFRGEREGGGRQAEGERNA